MLDELRKILKHATIYGIGNVLGKFVGFIMIPFYTHYLTPTDYGTLELLDLSLTLVTLILTMWLNASVVRHYNEFSDDKHKNEAVSTVFLLATVIGTVVTFAGIYFSRPLASIILNRADSHLYVSLEAWSFLLSTINVVCLSYLRAKQRSVVVVIAGLTSLTLSLVFNIYFIAARHSGAIGVLYSSLISSTAVTLPLAFLVLRQVRLSFSFDKLKAIVAFGAPLIITSAASFTVNFSDRFFLRHFSTLSTVGVYALGYKFGFMLSLLVVQPFDTIWQARIYDISRRSGGREMFARLFEYYLVILVIAALGLSIVIKEVLALISSSSFHDAYTVVPVIALAYIFQGINRFVLAGAYIAKRTSWLAPVGIASAGLNIGLNMVLIPRYGMMGAAWATAISFCVMSVLSLFVSQRTYPIPYAFTRIVTVGCVACAVYCGSRLINMPSMTLQVSVKVMLLLSFPVMLYSFGLLSKSEVLQGRILTLTILHKCRLLRPVEFE